MFSQGTQFNTGSYKTPEELEFEKAVRDAMVKEAMQKEALNKQATNQQGMMQASAPPVQASAPPVQASASNPYADTSKWSDANWATALQGNLPTLNSGAYSDLTTAQTNDILAKDPNFFINLLKEGDSSFTQTENNNRNALTNYSGPAFTNTDDVYDYVESLGIDENVDVFGGRSGNLGGNGGLMGGGGTSNYNTDTRTAQHDFVNTQYTQQGKMPVYQDGDAIYVLNTGFGDNRPDLGTDAEGNKLKFDGSGGYYHESGKAGKGEYQKYVKQNKQGPDTDAFFDEYMPAVMSVAQTAFLTPLVGPVAAAGLSTATTQATYGDGNFDLGEIAKASASAYVSQGVSDFVPGAKIDNFVGDFIRPAAGSVANQLIFDGEVDWADAATAGLMGVGTGAVKDMFGDSYQTNEDELVGKGEGAQTVNSQDAVVSDGRGGAYITSAGEEVLNSTDFRGFLGPNGALAQLTGLDIPYMPTDYLGNAYDFLEDIGLGGLTTFALDFAGIEHGSTTSKETKLWDYDENGEPIYKDVNVETPNRYDERFFDIFSERGDTGEMTGIWTRNPNDWNGEGGFGGFNILGNMGNPYGQTAATPTFGDADYYSNPESPGFLANDYSGMPTASMDENIYTNLNSVFDGDNPEDLNSAELENVINQLSEEEAAAAEGTTVIPQGPIDETTVIPQGPTDETTVIPQGPTDETTVINEGPTDETTVLPPAPPPPPSGGGGGGGTPVQQKAEQDNYMIDKELYRLARITQIISLSEGDLASVQKRMAVLREQKEAIAGDIVGAVQKKSGKYLKQTYEEDARREKIRNV